MHLGAILVDHLFRQHTRSLPAVKQRCGQICQRLERRALTGIKLSWLAINGADRAKGEAFFGDDWRTGVEANRRRGRHQRVVAKTFIVEGVLDDEYLVLLQYGMCAKRHVARRFGGVQADARFEPLALRVNQRYQCDWRAAYL